jgi:hypothetical protein
LSRAALAHNTALTRALERLIIRTSLILGVYSTTRTFAMSPPGRSLNTARQMERLFVMEGAR